MKPGTVEHALALMEQLAQKNASLERARREPIAIVGMGCRFPGGADTPGAFWKLLEEGRDAVRPLEGRWAWLGVPPPDAPDWAGLLREEEVSELDNAFFEISDREARSLDPQQRLVLTVAWEALENAGVSPRSLSGSATAVFIGATGNEYAYFAERVPVQERDPYFATGAMVSGMAGRLSYLLGLQGPAVTLDTACSSSLVATHLACQSLRAQECALALAGGVNLILSPEVIAAIALTRALSPDGRCRTFDARANGFVRGEGCGVLVLKRLSDAQRDGDRVWAVIRGSAVNQDGRSTGLTAPNVLAQQRLLREALSAARVDPAQVDFVETHGTGTALGDPIELEALRAVLGAPRAGGAKCLLGALKTNIGHLEAAAGVAGMIKTALALHHRTLPRNLGFEALNPLIRLEGTALAVADRASALPRPGRPLLAGVSAFGLSGTNAHVVMEEAPEVKASEVAAPAHAVPLLLSARTEEALARQVERVRAHLEAHPEVSLLDAAHTLAVARAQLEERAVVVARERAAALQALPGARGSARSAVDVAVVLADSGGGRGSARGLYGASEGFRAPFLAACRAMSLDPEQALDAPGGPALLALHVALFRLCASWGVKAGAVMGSGVGEIAAAHVAGALSLEDAGRLAVGRGQRVKVAAVQAPELLVISSVTGARANAEVLGDPEHWVRQASAPARLAEGRKALEAAGFPLHLELGPGVASADALVESLASIHARGGAVEWSKFFSGLGGRRVELPSYPFQGRRQWLPPPASAPEERRVGWERLSLAETGAVIWSGMADAGAQPWLAEHAVGGISLCPAAAYLEWMGAARLRESGEPAIDLEQVSIERPLILAPGAKREIQVVLHGEDVALYSRAEEGGAWTRHARARARPGSPPAEARSVGALHAELEQLPRAMDGADFYAQARARGDAWGPSFQLIERLKWSDDTALAPLRAPGATAAVDPATSAGPSLAHPALLEAAAQLLAAVAGSRWSAPLVARRVARCRTHAPVRGESFWSRARVRTVTDRQLVGDVALHDEGGRLLVEIEGLELEPLESTPAVDPRTWTYARRWERAVDGPPAALEGRWLFVGADADWRRELGSTAQATFAGRWDEPAAAEALSSPDLRGAVFFARPDSGAPEVEQAASTALEALAPLATLRAPARLWWVTRGRWAVEDEKAPPAALPHAALWGLGLSLSIEDSTRWGGLIDLPAAAPAAGMARSLLQRLARTSGEPQVVLRPGATYVARLSRLSALADQLTELSPGAGYLITGGLGGLALKVAEWLADRGARHLILMGRTGVPERRRWRELPPDSRAAAAVACLRALEARGVHVTVAEVDVSDGAALGRWLEAYRAEERPPVRGVVHAAGILEPSSIPEIDLAALQRHLHPKLGGALHLERALANDPLDFFVMFSSAAALLTSPQLGAYAAANACLDAVADRRRAQGKPALSVAWGPWAEVGMASSVSSLAGRHLQVLGSMRPADALEAMGRLWNGPACAAVLPIDWERWRTSYRVLLDDPFYAPFAAAPAPAPGPTPSASTEDVTAVLAANLQQLLGSAEPLDLDESLLVLGLDSLMAYDTQHFIEERWRVEVPVLKLMSGASLNEIAQFVRDATVKIPSNPPVRM